MAKQPYIPIYTGDYLKDTRSLSLAAKGAWTDIIVFMHTAPERGVLTGTNEDFARMIGGTPDETARVLLELCLKKVCDRRQLENGFFQIICRRMVRESQISKVKAENGSKGGSKTQANRAAKTKQNTDNDIDLDNDTDLKNKKESIDFSKPDVPGDELVFPINTQAVKDLWVAWKKYRWSEHHQRYGMMGEQADLKRLNRMDFNTIEKTILTAIANKWKNLYPEQNGNRINKNAGTKADQSAATSDYLREYYSNKAAQ